MYLIWGPLTFALVSGCLPLLSLILLYVLQHKSLTAIGKKKASYYLLVFTRDTRNSDSKKSTGQSHLFILNNGSHGQNLRSTLGQNSTTVRKNV